MQFTTIGSTGLKVSRFCLGAMTFGGQADQSTSERILDTCIEGGVNFLDTADIYTGGESERILGELLGTRRQSMVVATKVGGRSLPGVNGGGLGRKHILESVEQSLMRLRTDYIDLYYLHFPDPETPFEDLLLTMDALVRSGKIRYWGVSNFSAWQCCELQRLARELHLSAPSVTESVYNLITRGAENELTPYLEYSGMGLTVFNPLAGGLLTGKHKRGAPEPGTRFALERGYAMRYFNDRNFDAMEVLQAAAGQAGLSLLELAVRWLLSRKAVDSLILGASKAEQAKQNLSFFDKEPLTDRILLAECDKAWALLKGSYFNYHY